MKYALSAVKSRLWERCREVKGNSAEVVVEEFGNNGGFLEGKGEGETPVY